MKRSATDVLRRGFENTLANWPLLLIRIAENIILLIIIVGAIVAAVVPVLVAAGIQDFDLESLQQTNPEALIRALFLDHWGKVLWLLAAFSILFLVAVAVHAFVVAGSARVYVDGERGAVADNRMSFRAFTAERWVGGGRRHWWSIFWIYNFAWTVAGAVILLPWLATLVAMLLIGQSPATIVTGCIGMVVSLLFTLVVSLLTAVWVEKAIVLSVAGDVAAGTSLRRAWRDFLADFGRHFIVAFVLLVIMIGGAGVIGAFSSIGRMNDSAVFAVVMLPMQIVISLLNAAFSAAVAGWFLASFAALGEDAAVWNSINTSPVTPGTSVPLPSAPSPG